MVGAKVPAERLEHGTLKQAAAAGVVMR